MNRRQRILYAVLQSLLLIAASTIVRAQAYPNRPIRVIVPFAPGGATDAVMRMLAPRLAENLGQQVVVDNRPGGASTIGMDMVAKSAPDGHVLGVANLSFAVNPVLLSKIPYDTNRDFSLVSLVTIVPFVLTIHPSVPVQSVAELVALAKSRPGSLNYSSSGNASATQMATELFRYQSGIDIVHVPYTGGGPALIALLSGQVSIYFSSVPAALPHYRSGKLKALGVTSSRRDPTLPGIPTVAESGLPGYEAFEWQGIVVPAGTPAAVVTRLHQETVKSLSAPDLREKFNSVGAYAVGSTPEEFGLHVRKEVATWSKVIKAAGIRIE